MIRTDLIAPLAELMARNSASFGEKIAFEDSYRSISHAILETETRNLAAQYIAQGLKPGQSVGIWLPNSVDWVVAVLAAIRAGGVAVPIAIDSKPAEVSYRLRDAHVVALVTQTDTLPTLKEALEETGTPSPQTLILSDAGSQTDVLSLSLLAATTARDLPEENIDAVSMLVYTSGTTGQPKGVQLTTRSMLWVNAACWAPIFGMGSDDVVLSPLPLFHSYALNFCVMSIVANGATEHIMERFSTDVALDLLMSDRFTMMPGVPTMFHYLMLSAKEKGVNPFKTLRRCASAGAILPAALNAEFEKLYGIELLDGYGITETSTMVTLNWPNSRRSPGSCGLPLPGLSVRIIDPVTGGDVPLGGEGELICRGPNVMQGYLNKPDATAAALQNGWYHTGDLAKQDKDGFLSITGRLKELIIRGGQNIAPAEVEETIVQMDGVRDCAVVGVSHETLGEVPVAFVVLEGTSKITHEAICDYCRTILSSYKLPSAMRLIAEIPRTGSGKILRFRLRELFESEATN